MKSINKIVFSPTNTTHKILDSIVTGLNLTSIIETNITPYKNDYTFSKSDLVVIGAPVYSGRIPQIVKERLEKLQGNNTPAIIVVVYGNRDFDDALLELNDLLQEKGFKILSAAAFIGEHSFSDKDHPIASNRPDKNDLETAITFGEKSKTKLTLLNNNLEEIYIPGNRPYKELTKGSPIAPVVINSLCNLCNKCITVCPTNAINMENPQIIDHFKCIKCSACIKICNANARVFNQKPLITIKHKLYKNFSTRKEPQLFF